MKGDFTRSTFDQTRHYSSVRMQQGRVQVDADWNEQQDITAHRIETEAADLIGGCGGPMHAAGFGISGFTLLPPTLAVDDFFIEPGRYYVDGILCENDRQVAYTEQPYLPGATPPPLTEAGIYLAYLDVWQRHVTVLEDGTIREVALGGPDHATRTQTVWQVKLHRLDAAEEAGAHCLSDLPSWNDAIAAGTGRMAAQAETTTPSADPCIVAPGGGFRRLENQLYRVEVHEGGRRNRATFKWSRDNGSITARWEGQDAADPSMLTVSSLGRDEVLRFASGQWVELSDDTHALQGVPGTLARVTRAEGQVITIDLATATGPVARSNFANNPSVRRWDGVLTGVTNQNWRDLEDGVQVRFFAGTYHTGDYWQIPARTATADVEWPLDPATNAPERQLPHGIHHHYCRLALLDFGNQPAPANQWMLLADCRKLFPPVTELTNLFYVGGDGQEAMPDVAQPGVPIPLAKPLQVGVANGQWPVAGATVRFEVTEGNGLVNGAASVEVATGADGVAACTWAVDDVTPSQEVQATLLDAAGQPVHLPIRFNANLSVAGAVAYDPAADCTLPASVTTVQEALDELCRRGFDEPGIHVDGIFWADGEDLRNDTEVRPSRLAEGLMVFCDDRVNPASIRNKPVCYVTLYLPFPIDSNDRELWGGETIGTRPLRLEARIGAEENRIFWQPTEPVRTFLEQRLFPVLEEREIAGRVLAYLTLKGNFIWSGEGDRRLYLDGEVFGALRDDGGTDALLPSGNRLRGGDLEMWFWLAPERQEDIPNIVVSVNVLDFGAVPVGSGVNRGLVVNNTGNAVLDVDTNIEGGPFAVVDPDDGAFSVPPGAERGVTVRFTPGQPVVSTGLLRFFSNDPNNPEVNVTLTGRGRQGSSPGFGIRDVVNIGDAREEQLRTANITTLEALAALDQAQLISILNISPTTARAILVDARRLLTSNP